MKFVNSHEVKDLIHKVPFGLFSGGIRYPVQRILSVSPLTSTSTFLQVSFLDSFTAITVNVPSFLLHHFPDGMLKLFDTVQLSFTMRTYAWRCIDMIA
jgi:hypothetical protein